MSHLEKVEHLRQLVESRGLKRRFAGSWLLRAVWRMGLEIHPPVFWRAGTHFFVTSLFLTLSWGALMRLTIWEDWGASETYMAIGFGIIVAFFATWELYEIRKFLSLPRWRAFQAA